MDNFTRLMSHVGLSPRPIQNEYARAVETALELKGMVSLLHADTGVGKSLGYLMPTLAAQLANKKLRVVVATHTHALMSQLFDKEAELLRKSAESEGHIAPSISKLLGKANFVSPERVAQAIRHLSPSAEQTIQLQELEDWTGTIAEYVEANDGELPCGLTNKDICMTFECTHDDLTGRQQAAVQSDVVITTHAMVMVDVMTGNGIFDNEERPTILLIDEADMFVKLLQSMQQRRLNMIQLRNDLAPYFTTKELDVIDSRIDEIRDTLEGREYAWDNDISEMARNTLDLISLYLQKSGNNTLIQDYESWINTARQQQMGLGVSQVRHEPAIVTVNPWFSRVFASYAQAFHSVILTSGTLSITPDPIRGMSWLRHDLGMDALGNIGLQLIFSPTDFGRMSFALAGPDFPAIYLERNSRLDTAEINPEWIKAVAKQVMNTAGKRLVVLTVSHDESEKLALALIKLGELKTLHIHKKGNKLRLMLAPFIEQGGILITAAGHVGLDIRDAKGNLGFDALVLTRVSYPKPNYDGIRVLAHYQQDRYPERGNVLAKLQRKQFIDAQNEAIRTMRQALGRGLRSHKDRIHVVICDPRFPLSHDLSSRYAALRNVIPFRFYDAYREAIIISDNSSNAEQAETAEVFF